MPWAPDYATDSELKSFLRIGDAVDDPELSLAITAASRAIDHYCNRQFGVLAAAEERTYEMRWSRRHGKWLADIDDLSTTAGLTVTVSGSAVTNYTLLPRNAEALGRPYDRILSPSATASTDGGPRTVLIDGVWGWASVPDTIKNACLAQANRIHKAGRDAPLGVAGSVEFGSELRLLPKMHAEVEQMLRPFRRNYPYV